MPRYKVDVTGPNNTEDVTHLTVDTDRDNGTRVMKRSTAVNSGNAGVAPASNSPSANNLAARKRVFDAAAAKGKNFTNKSEANKAAANTRKAARVQQREAEEKAVETGIKMYQGKVASAAALRNVKQKSNANAKLAANNVQALIVVKKKALETANAAHIKAVTEVEDAEAAAVAAKAAAEAAEAAAENMKWALLTRNVEQKAKAQQLEKDAKALRSQASKARSDEQSKRPSVKKTEQQVELATAELKEVETKKAVINAEQHAKETKKAAESVQNSQTPALVNAAVAAEAAAQQAREAANQASVEAGKQREAKPFLEPRKEPNVVFPEPYVAPLAPRSNPESVRVSKSNKERRNRNKARLNAATTRRANNVERAAATQIAKNTETLTKGETPVTNQALANKAAARRQRNMSAHAPPPPSNFALGKAAPVSMPRLAPGSRLPPINSQAVVPKLQSFPKPPEQTLPPPPQTRSSRSTLLTGRNNQLGSMAKDANDNEEESTTVVPARTRAPAANNDEFPNIQGGRRTRRTRRTHRKHRKHAKKTNKSKKHK